MTRQEFFALKAGDTIRNVLTDRMLAILSTSLTHVRAQTNGTSPVIIMVGQCSKYELVYSYQQYDVLQIQRGDTWLDFVALRDTVDAIAAVAHVNRGTWDAQPVTFRIARRGVTVYSRQGEKRND